MYSSSGASLQYSQHRGGAGPAPEGRADYAFSFAANPLAQLSSQTLREHNETLERLRAEQESIAIAAARLANQEAEENRRHLTLMDTISREEAEIIRLLSLNKQKMHELELICDRESAQRRETIQRDTEVVQEYEQEMLSLIELEQQILSIQRSVEEKLAIAVDRARAFRCEFQKGMAVMEQDHHDARVLSAHTQTRQIVSPSRAMNQSMHSRRVGDISTSGISVVMPGNPANSRVSPTRTVASYLRDPTTCYPKPPNRDDALQNQSRFQSPNRQGKTHQQLVSTVVTNVTHETKGGGAKQLGSALLEACSKLPMNITEVRDIVAADGNAVNFLDPQGNLPLHIACSSKVPSVDVIQSLLLAGSNTRAANHEGLTAFHLACLNPSDHDDAVKRFLVFQGKQDPNQRTSRGATALHLCSEDDIHFGAVKFLLASGTDHTISALLTDDGSQQPKRMTALDVARAAGGKAAKCRSFLEAVGM